MEILTVSNTILIIVLFILFFSKKLGSVISGNEGDKGFYKFDDSFTETEKKLLSTINDKFYNKVLNSQVGLDLIYTTLWQESGQQILQGKQNSEIIGDNGNSIGYFQIYKFGALPEVNRREYLNYKFEDLKNEDVNIFVGIKYLSYCLQSAQLQTRNKPLQWLVGKKYNGGLDETESSTNNMANAYADKYYSKYLKVKKFIDLNLRA